VSFNNRRRAAIAARFPGRRELSLDEMWTEYFETLPRQRVVECLSLVDRELAIPVGLLRPEDSWECVLAPVRTWNPLHWLRHRSIETDHALELGAILGDRQRRAGKPSPRRIGSLGEFVRSWCEID
jgi:hypothetical protein